MPYYVYLDMDRQSSNFEAFIVNMRENYSSGLMLEHKVVYILKCKKDYDWSRLGQEYGPSILRPN